MTISFFCSWLPMHIPEHQKEPPHLHSNQIPAAPSLVQWGLELSSCLTSSLNTTDKFTNLGLCCQHAASNILLRVFRQGSTPGTSLAVSGEEGALPSLSNDEYFLIAHIWSSYKCLMIGANSSGPNLWNYFSLWISVFEFSLNWSIRCKTLEHPAEVPSFHPSPIPGTFVKNSFSLAAYLACLFWQIPVWKRG